MIGGYDNAINYVFDAKETKFTYKLPFNPLRNPEHMNMLKEEDAGVQFSHTMEEQLGGQLEAGFVITGFYEDGMSEGILAEYNIPSFYAVRAVKM